MKLLDGENKKENVEDLYKVGNVIKYKGQTYMVVSLSVDFPYLTLTHTHKYGLLCLDTGTLSLGKKGEVSYDSLSELAESCGSINDELLTGKVTFDMGEE